MATPAGKHGRAWRGKWEWRRAAPFVTGPDIGGGALIFDPTYAVGGIDVLGQDRRKVYDELVLKSHGGAASQFMQAIPAATVWRQ